MQHLICTLINSSRLSLGFVCGHGGGVYSDDDDDDEEEEEMDK